MKPKRIEILGVPVDCVNMAQAVAAVDDMVAGDQPQTIIAVNPEKLMKAHNDEFLLKQINEAGLLLPDGIGLVFAARVLGLAKMERVPGAELMPAICARAAQTGYRVFLFGAGPQVNQEVAEILLRLYPGLQIAGNRDGYVQDKDMPGLIEEINNSKADILFIALGSPRQELWMQAHLHKTGIKVCQGVGGTFDVIAGKVKRAPRIFRKMHLEWLYRSSTEPRRLLGQKNLVRFSAAVLKQKFK